MMSNTVPEKKHGSLSVTSKAVGKLLFKSLTSYIGLSDDMLNVIGENEDMHYLIKLHHFIQKVRSSNNENTTKIEELKTVFKSLNENIGKLQKEQSKTPGSTIEKKKEETKKGKK